MHTTSLLISLQLPDHVRFVAVERQQRPARRHADVLGVELDVLGEVLQFRAFELIFVNRLLIVLSYLPKTL